MKKAHELPQAVNNLRSIWDKKKVEMKFTQVEAAKELGWTQGAISHYLNDITELGPAAVVKFANFLGVDPTEIDPNIVEHLPNYRLYEVKCDTSNMNSRSKAERLYVPTTPSTFMVRVKEPTALIYGNHHIPLSENVLVKMDNIENFPTSRYLAAVRKGEKQLNFYFKDTLTPSDYEGFSKVFAVLGFEQIEPNTTVVN